MAMNQVIPGITSPNKLTIPVGSRDHIQGLIDAPISLLEYGDYECPACGQAYRVVKAVQQSLGNNLCFAFRNFPLTTIHPHAEHAAEAAEAAAAQGNFWEMHDLLFENQNALEDEDLARNALIAFSSSVSGKTQSALQWGHDCRMRVSFVTGKEKDAC